MERSLPPDVEGPVYGELRVCVDLITWSIARPPPVCQVRARFWGERGYGCVFRPDDSARFVGAYERDSEASVSNTAFYCVRVKSLLFSRYLKDMNVLNLEVLDGKSHSVVGKAKVNVGEGADNHVIADGLYANVPAVCDALRVQSEQSFEELEDMIELDTPLPRLHTGNVHLYRKSILADSNVGSLPPLLRSSVASVGAYEGSSEGSERGYLDVDASLSEDASGPSRNMSHCNPSRPVSNNIEARGRLKGDSAKSFAHRNHDGGDFNSESDIFSSDSPASSVDRLHTHSKESFKNSAHTSQNHSDAVNAHSDSPSPDEQDASLMRSAFLRSFALQQSSDERKSDHAQDVNAVTFVSRNLGIEEQHIGEGGSVSVALNSSGVSNLPHNLMKNETAVQTSPSHWRNHRDSESQIDFDVMKDESKNTSVAIPHPSELTARHVLGIESQTEPSSTARNAPPAWNNILDSLSARLGAMRSRVVIAEQMLNATASASSSTVSPSSCLAQSLPRVSLLNSSRLHSATLNDRTKTISFADEPSPSAKVHVSPYSPVRSGNPSTSELVSDDTNSGENRRASDDAVTLSELADVFNSHDEAALLSSLFFAKAQQPAIGTRQEQSPARTLKSPIAPKSVSASSMGRVSLSPATNRTTASHSSLRAANARLGAAVDSPQPHVAQQEANSASSPISHSWFISVDSISFADSSQKVSVRDIRIVVKVPPAANARTIISPISVRVRWLGSRLPRHSLAVIFVESGQTLRVTVPSAPSIIIEIWERDAKSLEPRIVGFIRCPVRAGVSSSPAGSRIHKLTSSGAWAAVLDTGNFIYDGTTSIRNPLSGTDVGHASVSILQQTSDIVDGVVIAADAVATISGAVRCHLCRRIFKDLQKRRQKIITRKEIRLARPMSRRAAVEIASDSGSSMYSHNFKVEIQGLFGIGDWSGASSLNIRARFPGQAEWIESGKTAIVKGSSATLATSSYSWILPANQHLASILTDTDTGNSAGLSVHVHDGADTRRIHPPMRQYCLPMNELLHLSGAAMELCLSNTSDVSNSGIKKVFRIPAREFGQGCVLKVVLHCRVIPTTISTLTLTSLSSSSHPKLFHSNNSFILGIICASGLQTAAEVALASQSNSNLHLASIDGLNAFATVAFTPPASHMLPGLNGSHIYVTTVAPMTFAPKWDWKIQFPLQLSRESCAALAASSLTVSVYHRPISRVPGRKEEDILIGHAAAPLAHLFTKQSGLASWVPLVCGTSGLPAASILLFSNIEATTGEPKMGANPSSLLCDAYDIDNATGICGVLEASLEEIILLDGCVASLLGGHPFSFAQLTWRIPGLGVVDMKAEFRSTSSSHGPSTSRIVTIQSSVSRIFNLSIDTAHCMNERALEIDIILHSPEDTGLDPVSLGTCYIDTSPLLDRPSQFELPTQGRWLSGAYAVIHPSGSRCGAAVRVRLQLRFKPTPSAMKDESMSIVLPHSNSLVPAVVEGPLEASSPPLALPIIAASTLTLESVRHVVLPKGLQSDSVYLSLTTILDGNVLHSTSPALYRGMIELNDVISLHDLTSCDSVTVVLSVQNESNSEASILGSGSIDLSMLHLMKCISGWYSLLDPSGNCVAYVKLRVDSAASMVSAAPLEKSLEQLSPSLSSHRSFNHSALEIPSDQKYTETVINSKLSAGTDINSGHESLILSSESDMLDYTAPCSLEDLRNKMKELDTISSRLKNMLIDDDANCSQAGLDFHSKINSENLSLSTSFATDHNSPPQALVAYADSLTSNADNSLLSRVSSQIPAPNWISEKNESDDDYGLSSLEKLQQTHLDLQQQQQQQQQPILMRDNWQQNQAIEHLRFQRDTWSPHPSFSESTNLESLGNYYVPNRSLGSSPSSRNRSNMVSATVVSSSSDSEALEDNSTFLRADVLTTNRRDKISSSASSNSASLRSSVTSSQEFHDLSTTFDNKQPSDPSTLESGIRLRQKYDAKHQRLASILFPLT